jgi:hypothetical protein
MRFNRQPPETALRPVSPQLSRCFTVRLTSLLSPLRHLVRRTPREPYPLVHLLAASGRVRWRTRRFGKGTLAHSLLTSMPMQSHASTDSVAAFIDRFRHRLHRPIPPPPSSTDSTAAALFPASRSTPSSLSTLSVQRPERPWCLATSPPQPPSSSRSSSLNSVSPRSLATSRGRSPSTRSPASSGSLPLPARTTGGETD